MSSVTYIWIGAAAVAAILIVFIALYFYRQKKGVSEPFAPAKMMPKGDEKPKANTYTFAEKIKGITPTSTKEQIDDLSKFLATYKAPSSYYPREKEQLYRIFHDCVAFNENIPTGTKEGFRLFLKDNIGVEGIDEKPEYIEKKDRHIAEITKEKAEEIKKAYDAAVFDYSKAQNETALAKAKDAVDLITDILFEAADCKNEDVNASLSKLEESKKITLSSCSAYKKLYSLFDKAKESDDLKPVASDVFFVLRKEYDIFFDSYVKIVD